MKKIYLIFCTLFLGFTTVLYSQDFEKRDYALEFGFKGKIKKITTKSAEYEIVESTGTFSERSQKYVFKNPENIFVRVDEFDEYGRRIKMHHASSLGERFKKLLSNKRFMKKYSISKIGNEYYRLYDIYEYRYGQNGESECTLIWGLGQNLNSQLAKIMDFSDKRICDWYDASGTIHKSRCVYKKENNRIVSVSYEPLDNDNDEKATKSITYYRYENDGFISERKSETESCSYEIISKDECENPLMVVFKRNTNDKKPYERLIIYEIEYYK